MDNATVKKAAVEPLKRRIAELTQSLNVLGTKTAAYVEAVQPQLDKQARAHQAFTAKAAEAAGVLADRGLIEPTKTQAFVMKVASDPAAVFDLVTRLARLVGPDAWGKAASGVSRGQPAGGLDSADAILFQDENANGAGSPLSVE